MSGNEMLVCEDNVASRYYDEHERICRLPADSPREALELLETIATGGALGTGQKLARLGVEIPRIRGDYERQVRLLIDDIARRQGQVPLEELARYASRERVRIARSMRWRQGVGSVILLEARDNWKYGWGGRTFPNMQRRYAGPGIGNDAVLRKILNGATAPNVELSQTAVRGARYLSYGGKAIVVVSVATTGYRLLNTPQEELPRVMSEEAGSFIGGAVGAEAAVGLCLVFGIVTGGWGLLGCGVLGGLAGGIVGAEAGNRLYYSTSSRVVAQANATAIVAPTELSPAMPLMCQ
jgi:hypothetical protein